MDRIIWTWWSSGEETLTPFLQLCLKSWRVQHSQHAWEVVVLDSRNLWQYLSAEDLPSTFTQIKRASLQSDLVRLAILAKYGGCYVDMSSLALQATAEAASARIEEGACLVGYRAPHFIPDFVSAWFLAAPAKEPLVVEWSKQFNHVMEGRVDDKGIHRHALFEGVDLSDYLRQGALSLKPGASSLWVEYLVVNLVLKAILDKDLSLKQRFWSRACLVPESDPSLSPVLWSQSQEHLIPEDVAFPENEKMKMRNLLKQDPDFTACLMSPPMLKFFNSGSPFAHLSTEDLLSSPSVLGCLIRKALGSLVDASQPPAEWPRLPVLHDVPWPVPQECPWAWEVDGHWTRPQDLPAERVAIATIVVDQSSAVSAQGLARSLVGRIREGTGCLCLVPRALDAEVCLSLEAEGWQVIRVGESDVERLRLHLWNLPAHTQKAWDRVLYIHAEAIAVGDLQKLLYTPEMEPPLGGVAMTAEYEAAAESSMPTSPSWSTEAGSSSSEVRFNGKGDDVTVASTSMLPAQAVKQLGAETVKVSSASGQCSRAGDAKAAMMAAFKPDGYCSAAVLLLRPSTSEFRRLSEAQEDLKASAGDLLHEVYTKRGLTKLLPKAYNAQKWLRICAPELWQTLGPKIISLSGTSPWRRQDGNVTECFEGENSACADLVRLWHDIYQKPNEVVQSVA